MKVKPKVSTYEVFYLQSKSQLPALRDWLRERGWMMQIQDWEDTGFFRPDIHMDTNYFDVYFHVDQYVLVSTMQNDWHFHTLKVTPNLDSFEIL